ncbi:MAG: pantoate--beta-alanine ligase [Polyangiaceae bacterium]|nr:pantoate--beta-alanine ligase [Polyangiaceae bacterium]
MDATDIWRDPEELRRACDEARRKGLRVGLVPTMGALHAGHTALIHEAAKRADFVAVTVFVNPTQFGPNEDLAKYPRTLESDIEKSINAGAKGVFAPSAEAMYPPGDETRVRVPVTSDPLCGAHRPGHFEGVATIVTKLFALAGPCVAVFGRKDYQQLQVIKRLARDLFLPVDVVGMRTVREPDGLAISSRNAYLSQVERQQAVAIPRGLSAAVRAFQKGERDAGALRSMVRSHVEPIAKSIDYVDVADPDSLRVLGDGEKAGDRALVAVAVRTPSARLIDNVVLGEDPAPLGALE